MSDAEQQDGLLRDFFVVDEERAHVQAGYRGSADAAPSDQRILEYLSFRVEDEEYGIAIGDIQEIIRMPAITAVPRTPDKILGVLSLRGVVVPVVDLGLVVAGRPSKLERTTRVLVLEGQGDPLGLVAHAVHSVVRLGSDSLEPAPRSKDSGSDLVQNVGRTADGLLIILGTDELLRLAGDADD